MIPTLGIIGYTERPSYRPGETVRAMVSLEDGSMQYSRRFLRLTGGDDKSPGPGYRYEALDDPPPRELAGRRQAIDAGSYIRIEQCPAISFDRPLCVAALICPSIPARGRRQAILARRECEGRTGFGISLDPEGAPEIWVEAGGRESRIAGRPLRAGCWYLIVAVIERARKRMEIHIKPVGGMHRVEVANSTFGEIPFPPNNLAPGRLLLAAADDFDAKDPVAVTWQFDGRIEAPALFAGAFDPSGSPLAPSSLPDHPGLLELPAICRWDFSRDIGTPYIRAIDRPQADGLCVNLPTRAVAGAAWAGQTTDWRQRPDLYGAIHFHGDDLEDCRWEPGAELALPSNLPSGIYAIQVRTSKGAEDIIPFFVLAPRSGPTRRLAFLAPTFTYLAYANAHHGYEDPLSEPAYGTALVLSVTDLFLNTRRDLGASLYDRHLDGSGACISSWRRPILNMRPGAKPWNFAADLDIIGWLEEMGLDYDVITDDCLHAEGAGLLEPHGCVITGTHPEYHSRANLDALESWLRRGGRLFYAGGNGFYWKVATSPHYPGAIEVRRGESGTRCFETPAGERHHQFDGEFGGLWRANGRPPQSLVGIGFVAEGFDTCSYFLRTDESRDARAAFIFEGVEAGERIGDFGHLGGAAGLELDASDPVQGTPEHALVLARSVEHSNVYLLTPEAMISSHPYVDAISNPLVRAEMVFFETPSGGAVFATGSIAWATSLAHNLYRNNVARISGNVIRRFLDPTPFPPPPALR